jgi:hypothetical protein
MNNKPTQKELELEIMELEDELAYKKEQLERLYRINTNGRYFLDEGGGVRELIPPVNILAWEKVIRQGNTFKTVEDAEKESDRRTLLYEFNQFRDECNGDWKPDWKDFNMSKYFVAADSDGYLKSVSMYGTDSFVQFGYFHNYKDCMDAIEKFGDRIKKLYID